MKDEGFFKSKNRDVDEKLKTALKGGAQKKCASGSFPSHQLQQSLGVTHKHT